MPALKKPRQGQLFDLPADIVEMEGLVADLSARLVAAEEALSGMRGDWKAHLAGKASGKKRRAIAEELHQRIAADYDQLVRGARHGEKGPTVEALAKRHGVSIQTVGRAIKKMPRTM